jgi:esterase
MVLFFRQVGNGRPMIILHGIFGISDNWLTVSKLIAENNFSVYSLDARNHGQSPHSEEFSYQAMADDLMQFIEEHSLVMPVIIGHSMGGKVVMQFAESYPEAYSQLIIVDIAPKFYPPHHQHILAGLKSIDLANLKNRNEADLQLAKYVDEFPVRQFLLKNLYRTPEGTFNWRINLPVLSREINNIGDELQSLSINEASILFIRGGESNYIEDEDVPMIKRLYPNAIFETIVGAGHWVQADKPAEFVAVVLRFCT